MTTHSIAVIAGDGIGREVIPEGLRVLEAAAGRFALDLRFTTIDWANCDYYQRHGAGVEQAVVSSATILE